MATYEEMYEASDVFNEAIDSGRDDAMDKLDEYFSYPETVQLVSNRMEELLMSDSEYMKQAKAQSAEEMEQRGMLKSDFWEGVGEAKAIDNAYAVAQQDIYTQTFDATMENQAWQTAYIEAFKTAQEEQWALGNIAYADWSSFIEEASIESSRGFQDEWDEAYDDMMQQLKDKNYEYQQYFLEKGQEYAAEYMDNYYNFVGRWDDDVSDFEKEMSEKEKEYADHFLKMQLDFNYDVSMFSETVKEVAQGYENFISLNDHFLKNYKLIQESELDAETKAYQLQELIKEVNQLRSDFAMEGTQIKDNVWDFDPIGGFTDGFEYDESALLWEPTQTGGFGSWSQARDVIRDVYETLHEDYDYGEFSEMQLYKDLEFLRGECNWDYSTCYGGFDEFREEFPIAGREIEAWYRNIGSTNLNEDSLQYVLRNWVMLTNELRYLDSPNPNEAWEQQAIEEYQRANPTDALSPRGTWQPAYKVSLNPRTKQPEVETYYTNGVEVATREQIEIEEQYQCIAAGYDSCHRTDFNAMPDNPPTFIEKNPEWENQIASQGTPARTNPLTLT